jgi:hypothetical protein
MTVAKFRGAKDIDVQRLIRGLKFVQPETGVLCAS